MQHHLQILEMDDGRCELRMLDMCWRYVDIMVMRCWCGWQGDGEEMSEGEMGSESKVELK